ncbi:MAG: Na(+)-translocating NADH-quinone reductase subunit A [candidate division BRC1 bacterium ADurb.BinA364]|nr:MAG: Na(+)-translocating NADH-quinone reductase subunit A [candidate division BRC1 bacterium ADurb.BinA364]
MTAGELQKTENRVISGSVFHGRSAMGDIHGYLGRYDSQVSALEEGRQREFLGWLAPGAGKFSILPAFLSYFLPKKSFRFTTSLNGSGRAMVPIGAYERVCPLDIIPTYLLRALITGDLDMAEKLGCLELDEEDMGLFTFVCPSKIDWAPKLRRILDELEKEME